MTSETRRRSKRPSAAKFYAQALTEAERLQLQEAEGVEGIDAEIALLRLRVRQALAAYPGDLTLMFRGIDLLARAVSARYRLPRESRDELLSSIARAVKELSQIAPEDGGV